MSWYVCYLCHRGRQPGGGDVWREHYRAEHFRTFVQVTPGKLLDIGAGGCDNGSAPASGKLPGRDQPLSRSD